MWGREEGRTCEEEGSQCGAQQEAPQVQGEAGRTLMGERVREMQVGEEEDVREVKEEVGREVVEGKI